MDPTLIAALSVGGAATAFTTWWNTARKIPPSTPLERPGAKFPEGFLWGSGEDPYQHEGHNENTDWHRWQHEGPSPIDNSERLTSGTDFWNKWPEDLQRAKDDHHNAHRIGVEWSRIEPRKGEWDDEAIAKYRDMLRTMKEHGFVTMLNLWHFTLPLWAADEGGWINPELMDSWERYVKKCAQEFAPYVDYWSTMIDSQIYPLAGYYAGDIPPNKRDARDCLEVYQRLIHAHARAYRLLKEHARRPDDNSYEAKVGQIYFFFDFHRRGFLVDPVVRSMFRRLFNWGFLDGVIHGDVNLFIPFAKVKEKNAELAGTMDWLGINYFTRAIVAFNPLEVGMVSRKRQTNHPHSDMEWEIFPEGLYNTVQRVRRRYGDELELIVTECGLADADDSRRPRFIVDHLAWVHRCIEEGANLTGFMYWSLTDNWEWKHGSWPRFGLYGVDYETKERTRRGSAELFARIAAANAIPEKLPPPLT
jgi:beta-glucosidase